jgi:hypothetical protein
VWPSIVSPTAAIVTDRSGEGVGEGLDDGDGVEGVAAGGGGPSPRVTAQAMDPATTAPTRRTLPAASLRAPPAGP